ncbi:MAG: hypothetical protein DI535_22740 [Citrobacter freundii]|nr:MAG: hypothetical protein DI535_22740 [Citrobacter freundii]
MNQLLTQPPHHGIALSEKQISQYLIEEFRKTDPNAIILTEVNIQQGTTRIDQLVLDQHILSGIEIKSDLDNLSRLKRQIRQYLQVVDFLTIVGTPNNIIRISSVLPANVGLLMVYRNLARLQHIIIRPASLNQQRCRLSLVQLLWKNEIIDTLRALGHTGSMISNSRQQLWQRLANHCNSNELSQAVVRQLRKRYYIRSQV